MQRAVGLSEVIWVRVLESSKSPQMNCVPGELWGREGQALRFETEEWGPSQGSGQSQRW